MTAPLTPDYASSWFNTIYSMTEKSTPITLFFMLLVGSLFSWYILNELARTQNNTMLIYQELLKSKEAQLVQSTQYTDKLIELYYRCNPNTGLSPPSQ